MAQTTNAAATVGALNTIAALTGPTNRGSIRIIDSKAFTNILNKRVLIEPTDVGSQLILTIQGDGQLLAKGFEYTSRAGKTENMFDRRIYNVQASSAISMSRKENRVLLAEALKAESVGNMELATEKYNAYLNAVQLSFSVIINPGVTERKYANGDQIKATIALVATKAFENQLVLENVSLKPAVVKAKTKYAISDLLGDLLDGPSDEVGGDDEAA